MPRKREQLDQPTDATASKSEKVRPRRKWIGRLLAIGFGLLILLGVELGLRIANWPQPSEQEDPYIGFQATTSLFQLSDDENLFETAPERQEFFRPDTFAAVKGEKEFRIFCLGGSTVQGRPYQIETSFTTWLELELEACQPEVDWEVVNCGGVSYASYRLVPVLEEVIGYAPDLIVLYTGHNEFLEDRTYSSYRDQSAAIRVAHEFASRSKIYQAMRFGWNRLNRVPRSTGRELLSSEVEARLDFEGGLDQYHRDEDWRSAITAHYELNLSRMIRHCQSNNVPVVLIDPVENLRDCGPFKSQFSDHTSQADRQAIERAIQATEYDHAGVGDDAIANIQQAIELDPYFALSHYRLGQLYDQTQQFDKARESYQRSLEEDICPLRMLNEMHESLHSIARQYAVDVIDIRTRLESQSPNGILDRTWMLDHVHPTIDGHRLIANQVRAWMESAKLVHKQDGWEQRRDAAFEAHWDSLEYAYFEHGRMRLEGLRYWTEGRAHGALSPNDKTPIVIEGSEPSSE